MVFLMLVVTLLLVLVFGANRYLYTHPLYNRERERVLYRVTFWGYMALIPIVYLVCFLIMFGVVAS